LKNEFSADHKLNRQQKGNKMKHYDLIVIGFGKGGKTLAAAMAAKGRNVALIERSAMMYGGTCINVACIPSKTLEYRARLSAAARGDFEARSGRYRMAIARKRELTAMLRGKNYDKLVSAGVEVLTADASFIDEHRVLASFSDGSSEELYGEEICINTGARPFIPPVEGLPESRFAYTSETLMELDALPRRLAIVGGGYIGLEFASYYTNFGSEVTIIQDSVKFIPREDSETAAAVLESLRSRGVRVLLGTAISKVTDTDECAELSVHDENGDQVIKADAVLIATGRRPELSGLRPEAAGIQLTERGAVRTDEHLCTNVPHIHAMGDVAGGLQFTYISLDDSRIVMSHLAGDESRTTRNRGAVPYSVFLDPPLSRVGLSEDEAVQKGYHVKIARLPAAAVPKAHVTDQPAGFLKAVIDGDTGMILGAHLFCAESQEMINLIKLAMDAGIPYTTLRDNIYTHPTMSEALNDLFAAVGK